MVYGLAPMVVQMEINCNLLCFASSKFSRLTPRRFTYQCEEETH
jgi:hypothetical protein